MLPEVSRRGVYYNLEKSPHWLASPCGDIFKFSTSKKMEIFKREISQAKTKAFKKWGAETVEQWTIQGVYPQKINALYHEVYNNGRVR